MLLNRLVTAANLALLLFLLVTVFKQQTTEATPELNLPPQQRALASTNSNQPQPAIAVIQPSAPHTATAINATSNKLPDFIAQELKRWNIDSEQLTESDWQWFLQTYSANQIARFEISPFLTVLTHLLSKGEQQAISQLADSGLLLNTKDGRGRLPLQNAAAVADFDTFERLINLGADIELVTRQPESSSEHLSYFIDANPDTVAQEQIYSYLAAAGYPQRTQNEAFAQRLLTITPETNIGELLAEIDVSQPDLGNLLAQLLVTGITEAQLDQIEPDTLELFIADPTLLSLLARGYHTDNAVIDKLINAGVDVNQRYGAGYTPIMVAAMHGNTRFMHYLMAHGADPLAVNDSGVGIPELIEHVGMPAIERREIERVLLRYSNQ